LPKVRAYLPGRWLACRAAKGGAVMTIPAEATRPDNGFIDALHVSGPADEHVGKLMLFGQFVGSWDLEWAGTGANGEPATATGELHFGWVLGGRAVQDIWIVPGRGQPGEGQPPSAFHGSTTRFFDPSIDAWRPTQHRHRHRQGSVRRGHRGLLRQPGPRPDPDPPSPPMLSI